MEPDAASAARTDHTPRRVLLGRRGEELAASHLRGLGLEVVARNWRIHTPEVRGELDVVAVDRAAGMLVVCEVKTRSGQGYGGPLRAVTPSKQARIRSLAMSFVRDAGVRHRTLRFDVIGVWLSDDGSHRLRHVPGAF